MQPLPASYQNPPVFAHYLIDGRVALGLWPHLAAHDETKAAIVLTDDRQIPFIARAGGFQNGLRSVRERRHQMAYRSNPELFEPSRTNWKVQPSEQVMDTREQLRAEYRKTWETFSRHMTEVHALAGAGEVPAVEAAMRKADLAMAAHQTARNNLAALLAPKLFRATSIAFWPRTAKPAESLAAVR